MIEEIEKITYIWIDRHNNGWSVKVHGYTKTSRKRPDGSDAEEYVTLAFAPKTDDELLSKVGELLQKQKEEHMIMKGGKN